VTVAGQQRQAVRSPAPVLELRREAKIRDLLSHPDSRRFEASGVVAKGAEFYVVFDNTPQVARIGAGLAADRAGSVLIGHSGGAVGYEDIAHDGDAGRFHVLVEALPYRSNRFMAQAQTFDEQFRHVDSRWLDFPLDRPNKGLEGLTCVRRAGRTYLLGLCEGNRCKAGAEGRRPGGGRIQLFVEGRRRWEHAGTVRLPKAVRFEDYSSVAVAGDRVAVVSQASSALWVAALRPGGWEFVDDGLTYRFPTDERDRPRYGNVEGVAWISGYEVVVVSDKAKRTQPRRCRATDRSIHVFALPEVSPGTPGAAAPGEGA
jgi:hypothetical protein